MLQLQAGNKNSVRSAGGYMVNSTFIVDTSGAGHGRNLMNSEKLNEIENLDQALLFRFSFMQFKKNNYSSGGEVL
jgi:hypothetical protein